MLQNLNVPPAGTPSRQPVQVPIQSETPPPLEQHTPPPQRHVPLAWYTTPACTPRLPGAGASGQVPPLCFDNSPDVNEGHQADGSGNTPVSKHNGHGTTPALPLQGSPHHVQIEMPTAQQPTVTYPVAYPHPHQPIWPGQHVYSSYSYPSLMPVPNVKTSSIAVNTTNKATVTRQSPYVHFSESETACHSTQGPSYIKAMPSPLYTADMWVPNTTPYNPHVAFDHAAANVHPGPPYPQTPTPGPHIDTPVGALPPTTPSSLYTHPCVPPSNTHGRALHSRSPPMAGYGSLMQTHQVKNVQVFTGNPDCKILVEDWVRDMQYLLEAIELPPHLRFSTVVRHLSSEARKLILNLPPYEQTPEKAFEELRAEYGDTRGSLDPLADFYERCQNSGESACSYAIALEAKLRAVEDKQRGGKPFPERDSKLTRQFMRGLTDEDVYMRIAPMTPRLLSFRELQAELRHLAREVKKFQPFNKAKKAFTQVHVTSEESGNVKRERTKPVSELSELTEMVKRLALSQEEQMAKLAHLELRIASPPPTPFSVPGRANQNAGFTCFRCGRLGHTARVCRAVLPDTNLAAVPQPNAPAEGRTSHPSQPLNA